LWTSVAYGLGAAAYLGLKSEPPLWPLIWAAAIVAIAAGAARRWSPSRGVAVAAALTAVTVCGFAGVKLRTELAAAPIAPAHLGVVPVEGFVVDVANPSDHGARLLIAPVSVGGLAPEDVPKRVRLVVPTDDVLGPGAPIRVLALVDPPPGPAAPGAYDFARDAYFDGIGGVGLAMKPPTIIDLAPPPWSLRVVMAINAARWSLAQHLAGDMQRVMGADDGGAAGLVVTVTTSHEDWLDDQSRDDLRGSSLAHMLAIAALLILLIQPEVVVSPGFEMSFCATASLVALAELWPIRPRAVGLPWLLAALQRARDWTLAILAVSFVAGTATGPFAIQHFNRVASYGVFANLTADFLASVVLMPAVAIAALGELLGISSS
jgi:competence protein ComEC